MALEASHIRFALDIKDRLGVQDIDAYVSGSIYPDSQYITGAGKLATHPKEYQNDRIFFSSDFRKGWFAHLLCDTAQQQCMKEMLPKTFNGTDQESWEKRTAIRILQDIDDAKRFDLAKYLLCLRYIETPNGEDPEKMHEYNDIFPDMYADLSRLDTAAESRMWERFGIS
jgi:hypothetical protein